MIATFFKMVKSCAAPNCKNRADKSLKKGVTFHLFPRNARKRQNWLNQMIDSTLSSWQPSPFSVICSEHFEDSSFRYLNGKRLVKDEAFPTKFLHSKEKNEISQVSPGLPIKMTFTPTETDAFIENWTKVDHGFNSSLDLSDQTSDKQDHLNPIISVYGQDLLMTEQPSSQEDLDKSNDLAVDIMFEVADFPESHEQISYPTESNLSKECISQFIEEVHLEIPSDLTEHIQTSFQPSPPPLPPLPSAPPSPPPKLINLESDKETNKLKTPFLKDDDICEKIDDLLVHKNPQKAKTPKDYRGPSKKAKLAITLFRKAMRLSELGLDVFLVVQELPHCPTYWGTKRFINKFMLSKPLVDIKKSQCYNAEECYNFSGPDESEKNSLDSKKAMATFPDPLLDSNDHTYSLCNHNIKDGYPKVSKSGQIIDNPAKEDDLFIFSDPNESSFIAENTNSVQRSEKNYLSEKIDHLIAQNDKICSMRSVLSTCKSNEEKKIFRLPSASYDLTADLYNSKDSSMNDFDIGQEYLVQQNSKRTNESPEHCKNLKSQDIMKTNKNNVI